MIIERINDELVLRIPTSVKFEDVQRFIDWLEYKEATSRSKAKQEDINQITKEVQKDWWKKNRNRFISQTKDVSNKIQK